MPGSGLEFRPTDEQRRALVQRIVASKEFQRANRLRDFLLYIVDGTVANSPHELTETLIGHRVFGRPAMYNTGEDSIVRTEARILRQRLERYFTGEGRDEPIVLEIPKGAYVPAFHRRDSSIVGDERRAAHEPVPVRRLPKHFIFVFIVLAGIGAAAAGLTGWRILSAKAIAPEAIAPMPEHSEGLVNLEASDVRLVKSFQWAKQRALAYTYTRDPVGDWYDSTAGNRYAFCMRDVSHQSTGAAVLGLSSHTRNMLRRFAASISAERSWCGFWEINKDGFPAPMDYRDDKHFWFCLPANFDLMQACYRQLLWTGDQTYFDAVFSNFYDRTVTDYVQAWDLKRDGVMKSSPDVRPRGIPSYYQGNPRPLVGADLVAAQYKGYRVYAALQEQRGGPGSLSQRLAAEYREKARALQVQFNTQWWNPVQNRYYSLLLPDSTPYPGSIADTNVFPLLFELTESDLKTNAALDSLEKNRPPFDQTLSYLPEVLFQYGRNDSAYQYLLELADPNFRGRGMPEIVFAFVGATSSGLAGMLPDAPHHTLQTLPRLPKELQWVKLTHVPVLRNKVSIRHSGITESSVTNEAGPVFQWKVSFPAHASNRGDILVDGSLVPAWIEERVNHQIVVSASIPVKPGQTRTAKYLTPGSSN